MVSVITSLEGANLFNPPTSTLGCRRHPRMPGYCRARPRSSTTAASTPPVADLRAGVPNVVCSWFADQPFWAERVHALGAGPRPVPARRLTAQALGDAIAQPGCRRHCHVCAAIAVLDVRQPRRPGLWR